MISKLDLQSVIEKYHLNGLIENVKWEVSKDKQLTINFMSPSREMLGKVTYNKFPLPESAIGINNTTQLDKLLAITSGDLVLDYVKEGKVISKLLIADEQFNLNYALSDLLTIPKPGEYNGPEEYDVEVTLNNEIISALIKAKNALTNSENVVVEPDTLGLGFTFGGDVDYANKVSYYIQNVEQPETTFKLVYNSNLLKEILVCNKGMDEGKLFVKSNGLMKIMFTGKNIQSTYYIVAKEN